MAGQNWERREVLRVIAIAAGASHYPGFNRWAFAQHHTSTAGNAGNRSAGPYVRQFFSDREYAIVERITDIIIPTDDTPGARDAGVAEFIDFMVARDESIQYRFRFGTQWIDSHSRWLHGSGFLEIRPEEQFDMLQHLAYKDKYRPREEDGRRYFDLIREYTVMGFYTSRIGMQELEDPMLKMHYEHMPGCPDPDADDHRQHRYI
jgi:hypothetical protein